MLNIPLSPIQKVRDNAGYALVANTDLEDRSVLDGLTSYHNLCNG